MTHTETRFLLLYGGQKSGRSGFWVADLAEAIGTVKQAEYLNLWISTRMPSQLVLTSPPPASIVAGQIDRQHDRVEIDKRNNVVKTAICNFAQRSTFVFASNEISSNELPAFLSQRPVSMSGKSINFRPTAKRYWDIADVGLGIARQRILFSGFRGHINQTPQMRAKMPEATEIELGQWEQFARKTILPAGLYLPAKIEMERSSIPIFLRLDADASREDVPAMIFSSVALDGVKSGMRISRSAYFDCQGQHREANCELGFVG